MLIKAHLPCEHCGSSDAKAEYTNGSICFSCKHKTVKQQTSLFSEVSNKGQGPCLYLTDQLPKDAKAWLLKSRIYQDDIESAGIKYDNNSKRVMLPLGGLGNWQGRSLDSTDKMKYITYGKKVLPVFGNPDSNVCVLTEDWCSAYRVGKVVKSVPLLGTSAYTEDLLKVIKSNSTILLWLDGDKPGLEASKKLKRNLQLYYPNIIDIISTNDPKTYSEEDIHKIIRGNYERFNATESGSRER